MHCIVSIAASFFAIDPSGYVRVCNHSEHRLCRAWNLDALECDPYWQTFASSAYQPPMCASCDLSKECDGGCREAANVCGGSVCALDPLFTGSCFPAA